MTEYKDLRVKITLEAWAAIKVESEVTGREQVEIAREIIQEWALRRIRGATLLNTELLREGLTGINGDHNPRSRKL